MTTIRAVILLIVVCSAGAQNADECAAGGGLQFVCGPKNAEDLVLVSGTSWIISSGMAPGAAFYLIDSRDGSWSAVAPAAKHDSAFADCTTPPDVTKSNTHGLNLRAAGRNRATLYAVGHGPREAIEIYDVDSSGARPAITWKGCVPMPAGLAANSVASFANGGLVATVLLMPGKTFAESVARKPTGAVYEWAPGKSGFELVQGSELPGNNGIETSADGREIFVVSSGFQTIVAFSHSNPTRQLRTTQPLPITPDNVHMGADGRLFTAGMKNDEPACGGAPGPQHDLAKLSTCPRGFVAIAVDPATMKDTVIAQGPANPAFSNATMVLPFDGRFWIGTFSGDRVGHGTLR
jgi:hypothetical protein